MEYSIAQTDSMAEAGRQILATEWGILLAWWRDAETAADVTAVHEMRKALRRTFTALRLFAPFWLPEVVPAFYPSLRKIMRRLGRARDLAVFLENLDSFLATTDLSPSDHHKLQLLHDVWHLLQQEINAKLQRQLSKHKEWAPLYAYETFVNSTGKDVAKVAPFAPTQVRHLAPVLILQRVADVRAYPHSLETTSFEELHQLRVACKELRYTLEFFQPVYGTCYEPAYAVVKEMLDCLGGLNDAYVAWQKMEKLMGDEQLAEGARLYAGVQERKMQQVRIAFQPLWDGFESPTWRKNLMRGLAQF